MHSDSGRSEWRVRETYSESGVRAQLIAHASQEKLWLMNSSLFFPFAPNSNISVRDKPIVLILFIGFICSNDYSTANAFFPVSKWLYRLFFPFPFCGRLRVSQCRARCVCVLMSVCKQDKNFRNSFRFENSLSEFATHNQNGWLIRSVCLTRPARLSFNTQNAEHTLKIHRTEFIISRALLAREMCVTRFSGGRRCLRCCSRCTFAIIVITKCAFYYSVMLFFCVCATIEPYNRYLYESASG